MFYFNAMPSVAPKLLYYSHVNKGPPLPEIQQDDPSACPASSDRSSRRSTCPCSSISRCRTPRPSRGSPSPPFSPSSGPGCHPRASARCRSAASRRLCECGTRCRRDRRRSSKSSRWSSPRGCQWPAIRHRLREISRVSGNRRPRSPSRKVFSFNRKKAILGAGRGELF